MRRREFITLVSSAAAAPLVLPYATYGQQPTVPVVGLLNTGTAEEYAERGRAFRQGLSETGYDEHRNVAIEFRGAEGQYERCSRL
jgi:putative tryptophan/tyrosine transport system substrate-binding protein